MTSGGNAGAGAGAGANAPTAGAEGGIAESVSMASFGAEAETQGFAGSVDDPTEASAVGAGSMSEAFGAMQEANTAVGHYEGLHAATGVMTRAGMPEPTARSTAVTMAVARDPEALGGLTTQTEIAATAATAMAPGFGMIAQIGQELGHMAFEAGWDVRDPSPVDYGDTPQSTGGQGGVGVDMAAPAPTPAPAPPPAPPPSETVAAAPAPAPAPSGPTAATGATATPLSAVGAASTRARRRGRSSTIATSTLGVPQSATVARKTLLGS